MASQYELNESRDLDDDNDIDVDDNDEVSASDEGKNQPQEDFNIASRERVRSELQSQIEAFLANGGKINEVPNRVAGTDRPSKPASEYSGRLM
ncbi:hypothetical protein [Gilvimarinus agarilyticus]|uniref:hypothetical protein n=1 Tax=Gilvimarinus agarilyticus TaxID=679259 RepID=UPI00059FC6CF|nr:hypothetical protein [Gilvimarinus agarilyticus]